MRPVPYTIPHDGPVGRMLAGDRPPPVAPGAHPHDRARAGYRTLTTHIFDAESDYLDSDAVFAVKRSLVRDFEPRAADDPERPDGVEGEWYSVESDFVLVPESGDGGSKFDRSRHGRAGAGGRGSYSTYMRDRRWPPSGTRTPANCDWTLDLERHDLAALDVDQAVVRDLERRDHRQRRGSSAP